ncbi:MAG: hypothetical protein R2862_03755 [Thermoanaerobaculia bacterium]
MLTVFVREGPALLGATAPDHGPFRPLAYLSAILLFAGPGILFVATSAAAVAAATRRAMAVYALPTVLFLYTIGISWNFRPAGLSPVVDRLLIVLDPMAIRWLDRRLFSVDRGLAYFNSAPPELDLLFLVNRLLALLLPVIGFAVAVRCFRPLAGRGRRRRAEPGKIGTTVPENGPPAEGATFRSLGELAMTGDAPRTVSGVRAVFRAEVGERFRQPSLYFFLALLMLVVGEVGGSEVDLLGGRPLLSAGVLAVRTIPVVTILVCLYLLFSVVESAERDRATGFADILYASAVPDAALLLGRQLANGAVIASICAACVAAGLGTLAISAGSRIEPWPLVLVFVLVLAPTFLLWSAFCDAVAAIVRNRHAALAVGLVALVATGACFLSGAMTWASNWPLWGALRWSDLGLFPLNGPALLWNRVAALAGAVAFVALSRRFLVRTERDPSSILGRLRSRRLVRAGLGLLPFLVLPVLVQVFLAVRIQEGFQGSRARARADEFWLRNSATWQDEVPPAVEALDLVLDLEPRTRALHAVGTFELRNRAEQEIRWIPFTSGDSTTFLVWTVDGVPVPSEDRAGLHLLTLPVPVPPGGAVRVGFEHDATLPRGFTRNGGGTATYLLPAGVLLGTRNGEFLPGRGSSIAPPRARRRVRFRRGIRRHGSGAALARAAAAGGFRTRVEVRIPEPYSVQSVGLRTAAWHADGKVHTVFESEAPVDALNVVAGRWNVLREGSNEVHFHPAHAKARSRSSGRWSPRAPSTPTGSIRIPGPRCDSPRSPTSRRTRARIRPASASRRGSGSSPGARPTAPSPSVSPPTRSRTSGGAIFWGGGRPGNRSPRRRDGELFDTAAPRGVAGRGRGASSPASSSGSTSSGGAGTSSRSSRRRMTKPEARRSSRCAGPGCSGCWTGSWEASRCVRASRAPRRPPRRRAARESGRSARSGAALRGRARKSIASWPTGWKVPRCPRSA